MLDTIALSLKLHEFKIMDHDAFTPSSKGVLEYPYYPVKRGGLSCLNNPLKLDIARYGYMPRLTLSKRPAKHGFQILLRVEASLPKLIHGNNFDELTDTDFDNICGELARKLRFMKVHIEPKALKQADVSAVHYSKNLPLTDYTSCSMVISEVAKGSISRQLTSSKTDYYNDGSAFKLHSNAYEVMLYDKIKDMNREKISKKRALDYDNQPFQFSFLKEELKKPFEVLRLEVRLGNRKKIKAVLEKTGYDKPLTFRNLYSEALAQQVLLHYWKNIIPDMATVVCGGFPAAEIYDAFYASEPDIKPSQILQHIGALAVIKECGYDGLRTRMERHSTARSWYAQKKKLSGLSITSHMRYNPLRVAEQHLHEFLPLRLSDYKKE